MFKKSKSAFTLAEVLITLGIIGVVAAMTMPTLLNSTQGAQYRAAVKKELSVLSQAVVLNIALDDYDMSQTTGVTAGGTFPTMYNLFKNRMNVVSVAGTGLPAGTTSSSEGWRANNDNSITFGASQLANYTFFFNDGTTFTFRRTSQGCSVANFRANAGCKGALDVNGSKNPNRLVTCSTGAGESCQVQTPSDIYPVVFYDQTILPNSPAARAVLFKGKQ